MNRFQFIRNLFVGALNLSSYSLFSFTKQKEVSKNMADKIVKIKPLQLPWKTMDPFLMCVHHEDDYPYGNEKLGINASELKGRNPGGDFIIKDGYRMYNGKTIPGFPYHPHRGFETITIGKKGFVDHTDSLGGAGRFGAGDVEWMTAGKGILHSEMFPLLNKEERNPFEIFQIWLNLPSKSKFVKPNFKMLWNETIPKIEEIDANGKKTLIEVFAGNYKKHKAPNPTPNSWAANPDNHVSVLTIKMHANSTWKPPATTNNLANKTLYFYRGGTIQMDNNIIHVNHSIQVKPNESIIIENGSKDAYFLLLQGKPINEPVVAHGPFVMNTEAEIQDAFAEYRETKFGGWPWPEIENVHPRNKGRFALYDDGTEEIK